MYLRLYYKLTDADDHGRLALVTGNVAHCLEAALHDALVVSPTLHLVEEEGGRGRAETGDVGGFFSSMGSQVAADHLCGFQIPSIVTD